MTDTADIGELVGRLKAACVGHPATISWPHYLLHDAIKAITDLEARCAALEKERNATQIEYANHRHYHFDWKERAEAAERDLARKHEAYCIASDQAMKNGQAARAAESELATLRARIEREPVVTDEMVEAAVSEWLSHTTFSLPEAMRAALEAALASREAT